MKKDKRQSSIYVLPEVWQGINSGGPFAVVSTLHSADPGYFKYVVKDQANPLVRNGKKNLLHQFYKHITRFDFTFGILEVLKHILYISKCKKRLASEIQNAEWIIVHDVLYARAVQIAFSQKKMISVYHGQGSLYYQVTEVQGGNKSLIFKWYADRLQREVLRKSQYIGFPSQGAYQALIKTLPGSSELIANKGPHIFYNGVSIPDSFKTLKKATLTNTDQKIKIISSGVITKLKGFDQIPEILFEVKRRGVDFSWTIIGDGPESKLLESRIQKFNLINDVTWIKSKLPHSTLLEYFNRSDVYMMMHRLSIFDLATIEAMAMGCVPVLSNTGGNVEVMFNQNGLLLDLKEDSAEVVSKFLKTANFIDLTERNRIIASEKFSSEAVMSRYIDFAEKYCT